MTFIVKVLAWEWIVDKGYCACDVFIHRGFTLLDDMIAIGSTLWDFILAFLLATKVLFFTIYNCI